MPLAWRWYLKPRKVMKRPREEVYIEDRRGPRTEPSGTPTESGSGGEEIELYVTLNKHLSYSSTT